MYEILHPWKNFWANVPRGEGDGGGGGGDGGGSGLAPTSSGRPQSREDAGLTADSSGNYGRGDGGGGSVSVGYSAGQVDPGLAAAAAKSSSSSSKSSGVSVGYGPGQVDPGLAAAAAKSSSSSKSTSSSSKGTSGGGGGGADSGQAAAKSTSSGVSVGYGPGQVDPGLAAAVSKSSGSKSSGVSATPGRDTTSTMDDMGGWSSFDYGGGNFNTTGGYTVKDSPTTAVIDTPAGPQVVDLTPNVVDTVSAGTRTSATYDSKSTKDLAAQLAAERAAEQAAAKARADQITADKVREAAIDAAMNAGLYSEFGPMISEQTGLTAPASRLETGLAAGTGQGINIVGEVVNALGNAINPASGTVGVGYNVGQVDPALASAVTGLPIGAVNVVAADPNYTPNTLSEIGKSIQGYGTNVRSAALDQYAQNFPAANLGRTQDIITTDVYGNISLNPTALTSQLIDTAVPTAMGLTGLLAGPIGLAATSALMTSGEVAADARSQAYNDAISRGLSHEQATAVANEAAQLGALSGGAIGAVSGPLGIVGAGNIAGKIGLNALEEAITEGLVEPTAGSVAATQGSGRTPSTENVTFDPNTAIVGAITGGGITSVLGGGGGADSGQAAAATGTPGGTAPYGGMDTSGITPGFSRPGGFPGGTSFSNDIIDGTFTDVTPGYTPTGPTVGQVATSPAGIISAYQQAADTMAEAGVKGVGGGSTATSMDTMAAVDIINNEIAETGGLSLQTAQNLADATGLSMQDIANIAGDAPIVGTSKDSLITDEVTGVGGGSNIQVTPNADGTTTLTNKDTGATATVEAGQNLNDAIKVFDEVTTPIKDTVAKTTKVDEQSGAIAQVGNTDVENVAEKATEETAVEVQVQDKTNNQVAKNVTDDTGIVVDTTPNTDVLVDVPVDDVIEGTATEIVGEIPVETVETAVDTNVNVDVPVDTTVATIYEPEDETPVVDVDVPVEEEPKTPTTPKTPPTTTETETDNDKEEEPPFECPDGYTAVKLADRWVCQKETSRTVGRPTLATGPYLSKRGFAGANPRPSTTRTITTTQTVEGK